MSRVSLGLGLLVLGCSPPIGPTAVAPKTAPAEPVRAPSSSQAPESAPPAPEPETETADDPESEAVPLASEDATETGGALPTTGVPECDVFLSAYAVCIREHVPASKQQLLLDGLAKTQIRIAEAASDPEGSGDLPLKCKLFHDTARQSWGSWGCEL